MDQSAANPIPHDMHMPVPAYQEWLEITKCDFSTFANSHLPKLLQTRDHSEQTICFEVFESTLTSGQPKEISELATAMNNWPAATFFDQKRYFLTALKRKDLDIDRIIVAQLAKTAQTDPEILMAGANSPHDDIRASLFNYLYLLANGQVTDAPQNSAASFQKKRGRKPQGWKPEDDLPPPAPKKLYRAGHYIERGLVDKAIGVRLLAIKIFETPEIFKELNVRDLNARSNEKTHAAFLFSNALENNDLSVALAATGILGNPDIRAMIKIEEWLGMMINSRRHPEVQLAAINYVPQLQMLNNAYAVLNDGMESRHTDVRLATLKLLEMPQAWEGCTGANSATNCISMGLRREKDEMVQLRAVDLMFNPVVMAALKRIRAGAWPMTSVLEHPNVNVRRKGINLLGLSGFVGGLEPKDLENLINKSLGDEDSQVRQTAYKIKRDFFAKTARRFEGLVVDFAAG